MQPFDTIFLEQKNKLETLSPCIKSLSNISLTLLRKHCLRRHFHPGTYLLELEPPQKRTRLRNPVHKAAALRYGNWIRMIHNTALASLTFKEFNSFLFVYSSPPLYWYRYSVPIRLSREAYGNDYMFSFLLKHKDNQNL